jgi:hypothetical protein
MAEQSKFTPLNIPPPSDFIPRSPGTGSAFIPPPPDFDLAPSTSNTGVAPPIPPAPSDFVSPATTPKANADGSDDTATLSIPGPSDEIPAARPMSRNRGGMSFSR